MVAFKEPHKKKHLKESNDVKPRQFAANIPTFIDKESCRNTQRTLWLLVSSIGKLNRCLGTNRWTRSVHGPKADGRWTGTNKFWTAYPSSWSSSLSSVPSLLSPASCKDPGQWTLGTPTTCSSSVSPTSWNDFLFVEKNEQVYHICFLKDNAIRMHGLVDSAFYFVDISAEKLSTSQQPIKGRNDFLPIFSLFATKWPTTFHRIDKWSRRIVSKVDISDITII